MKRIKLKKKNKIKLSTKISTIIVFIIICTYIIMNYSSKKVIPMLMSEAEIYCKKMAIMIIKNSINEEVLKTLDDNMFKIVQNNNGKIQTIDFNPIIVNRFLTKTTSVVSDNLTNLEKGNIDEISFLDKENFNYKKLKNGVISEIPMGIITNNVFLSNLGPKVPVKLNLIGNVVSNVETKVRNYGINSALVEIIVKVEVSEQVIIPFQTKTIKIVNEVPVSIKIINGNVPNYYLNGSMSERSNVLSIPIQQD